MAKRTRKSNTPEPSGDIITTEEMDALVPEILAMEAYCQAFRDKVEALLNEGEDFRFAELVDKRPTTKWGDEDEARKLIAKGKLLKVDQYTPRKLIPQGEFKKLMKSELKADPVRPAVQAVLDLITSESSGTKLELRAHQKD